MHVQAASPIPLFTAALTLLCIVWAGSLLPRLSEGTLWQIDECLTAERSREMLLLGDYTSVHLYFAPNFNKPPLHYILTTFSMRSIQDPELAVRIWSLVYATASLILTALLYLELRPSKYFEAWMAAAFLATYAYWIDLSRLALLDAGLAFYTLLTILCYFKVERQPRWWLGVGAFSILGALQKIPLPALIVFILLLMQIVDQKKTFYQENKSLFRNPYFVAGIILIIFSTVGWPLGQMIGHAADYQAMLHHESERLTGMRGSKNALAHIGYLLLIVQKWLLFGGIALISLLAPIWTRTLRQNRRYLQLVIVSVAYLTTISSFVVINRNYMAPILPLLAIMGVWWTHGVFNQRVWLARLILAAALIASCMVAQKHIQRPTKDYSAQIERLKQLSGMLSDRIKENVQNKEKNEDARMAYALLAEKKDYESIESLFQAFAFFYGNIQPEWSRHLIICKSIDQLNQLPPGRAIYGIARAYRKNDLEKQVHAFEVARDDGEYILFKGFKK